jgi:3-oxoacyl-[acyl-carrier protein] reductase
MELEGKSAVVTGGANGIGQAVVRMLVAEKARVGVLDLDELGLARLASELPQVATASCDVSHGDQVERAVAVLSERCGSPELLVNSAGVIHSAALVGVEQGGMATYDKAAWDRVIGTNLSGVFYVTSAVVRRMVARRTRGVVVNVSSICAAGNAGQSAYSASKAGVDALTVTWAKELAPWGIRVAGIAPGFVETDTTLRSLSESALADWRRRALVRRLGTPQEIVEGLRFILRNDFFSGRVLELDGGLRI